MNDGCTRCTQCGNDPNISTGKEVKREHVYEKPIHKQKSRIIAGILQIVFPYLAAGRLYLGNYYIAIFEIIIALTVVFPVFTLFGFMFLPVGLLLPIYDAIRIFRGKVKYDAKGISLK